MIGSGCGVGSLFHCHGQGADNCVPLFIGVRELIRLFAVVYEQKGVYNCGYVSFLIKGDAGFCTRR